MQCTAEGRFQKLDELNFVYYHYDVVGDCLIDSPFYFPFIVFAIHIPFVGFSS